MQDGGGSPQGRAQVGAAEAFQRMHAEVRFQEGICQAGQESVAIIHQCDGQAGEIVRLLLADEQLPRVNAGHFLTHGFETGVIGHGEFAGGVVGAGESPGVFLVENGGNVVMLAGVQQAQVCQGAGRDDAGDFSRHQLAWHRGGHLLGNGNALAHFDSLANIALCCVVRHTAHRYRLALGKRKSQGCRAFHCILKEHFVEISQSEKQPHIPRQ